MKKTANAKPVEMLDPSKFKTLGDFCQKLISLNDKQKRSTVKALERYLNDDLFTGHVNAEHGFKVTFDNRRVYMTTHLLGVSASIDLRTCQMVFGPEFDETFLNEDRKLSFCLNRLVTLVTGAYKKYLKENIKESELICQMAHYFSIR